MYKASDVEADARWLEKSRILSEKEECGDR
jgi:hypothetical protein